MARQIRILRERGFSLLEVMIAITLFAFFISAFLTSQGYNVADATLSQEQLMLQYLAEKRINELILDPPKFTNATGNTKETKTFEGEDYSGYEYTLEIKKLNLPDFTQLFAQKGGADEDASKAYDGDYYNQGNKSKRNEGLEKVIFEQLKKNLEKIVWQARVTVTNKETKYNFTLSTFITNYNEKVQLDVGF